MSKNDKRTLYFVTADWPGDDDDNAATVLETFEDAVKHFATAEELWRLVGNDVRADEIEKILDGAYDEKAALKGVGVRRSAALSIDDIGRLVAAFDGLADAVKKSVLDEKWMVPAERLQELRTRAPSLDLDESRGDLARYGVGEGIGNVERLHDILKDALRLNVRIAID